jgi:hypothetical protein
VSTDLALAFGRDAVLIDVVSARPSREMRLKYTRICSLASALERMVLKEARQGPDLQTLHSRFRRGTHYEPAGDPERLAGQKVEWANAICRALAH